MSARDVALQVARDVFPAGERSAQERGAQEALDYRLNKAPLDARDRAFATMLAFGSIKMRRTLDWYLKPYVGDRDKTLPPVIAEILRLAVFELRFASSGVHAVVSEWVSLAKKYGHRGTAGLVNAVLRSFLRDDPKTPQPADFENEDDYLGTAFSYPTWLVRQWREVFGGERLETMLQAGNAPAQSAVVFNRTKASADNVIAWFTARGAQAEPSGLAEDCVLVSDGALARAGEAQSEGAWWVQSESSALVVDVLNPQGGEKIADACSGRGSKALQIAARMHGEGTLIGIERDAHKVAALQRRAHHAGLALATVLGDATLAVPAERFDRVLIDAPCSGTGVVGRHPEARWRKRPGDGERLAHTQRALLEAFSSRILPGGVLVYAVCSADPRETVEVMETFSRGSALQRGLIPGALGEFQTAAGDVLVPPGIAGRDGFFIARLEAQA
ncbi:MAG: transcription antitermination factor NusB [Candidatus Baltobacteraceae bacterium]